MGFASKVDKFSKEEIGIIDKETCDTCIRDCKKCDLRAHKINNIRVFSRGKFESEIMIVGIAPSDTRRTKKENHEIFGKEKLYDFFFEALKKSNIDYDSVYFTNLIKCSCIDKNYKKWSKECEYIFKQEIELVNPKLIILLGDVVKNYFNIDSFFKLQKKDDNRFYYAVYHPAAKLRGTINEQDYIKQFTKIKKLVNIVNKKIINLHCHDEYSIKDAVGKTEEVVRYAKNIGLSAVSITNHGYMSQIARLYFACKEQGLKPIYGCEVYINNFRNDEVMKAENKEKFRKNNHLVLYAKNKKGLENLIKITSDAFINGFYYSPRTDMHFIKKHSEGLIASSACLTGVIQQCLFKNEIEKAKKMTLRMQEIFNGNFYLELMFIEFDEQKELNKKIIELSKETKVPMIITFDSHYLYPGDANAQDVLLLMRRNQTIDDLKQGKSFRFETRDLYFKRYIDIYLYWKKYLRNYLTENEFNNCINNINHLVETIDNFELDISNKIYKFKNDFDELKRLIKINFNESKCYDLKRFAEYKERLIFELNIIKKKNFASYFLIMHDIVKWAEKNDIIVGPGRGSAAGSLICYILGITKIDPIRFGLLFERFINIDRDEVPDIDTDFESKRKDEVVNYILEKYKDQSLPIGTYSLFKTRAIIYDVLKVYKANYQDVRRIVKKIDSSADSMSWEEIEDEYPEFKTFINKFPKEAYTYIKILRNQIRNVSKHAAGLIISNKKIYGNMPIITRGGDKLTAYQDGADYRTLTKLGYIKFDILGLNNLSVIGDCFKLIKQRHNIDIDINKLDIEDKKAFKIFNTLQLGGIFQFESRIAKNVISLVKVNSFKDISVISALIRPGPLSSNLHVEYAKAKQKNSFKCIDIIKDILSETHGLIIYQEQIMLIAQKLADFELSEANALRKALFKYSADKKIEMKRLEKVKSYKDKFVKNGTKKGYSEIEIKNIWDIIYKFASYGFNKSHAVSYAMISYVEAYLKAYYPLEFMCSLLRNTSRGEANSRNKLNEYILESNSMGLKVESPDVNHSSDYFSIKNNSLLFGLKQIKNIEKAATKIHALRPIKDFKDVLKAKLNKSATLSLIFAGAFDNIEKDRKKLLSDFYKFRKEEIIEYDMQNEEVEAIGLCLSDIEKMKKVIKKNRVATPLKLVSGAEVYSIAKLLKINKHRTKKGRKIAFLKFQDTEGEYDVIAWSDFLKQYESELKINTIYLFKVYKNDRESLIIEDIVKQIKLK